MCAVSRNTFIANGTIRALYSLSTILSRSTWIARWTFRSLHSISRRTLASSNTFWSLGTSFPWRASRSIGVELTPRNARRTSSPCSPGAP
uniref:Candidate secreted effector n=1 Tax=Meloidogyne incognita TaxID=6306 RepID=A0A914MYS4_MELIC